MQVWPAGTEFEGSVSILASALGPETAPPCVYIEMARGMAERRMRLLLIYNTQKLATVTERWTLSGILLYGMEFLSFVCQKNAALSSL